MLRMLRSPSTTTSPMDMESRCRSRSQLRLLAACSRAEAVLYPTNEAFSRYAPGATPSNAYRPERSEAVPCTMLSVSLPWSRTTLANGTGRCCSSTIRPEIVRLCPRQS